MPFSDAPTFRMSFIMSWLADLIRIFPQAVAVNAGTNKIYLANPSNGNVTVIKGADNSTVTVPANGEPVALAIRLTNKIYVPNFSGTVLVINERR